jgi:hypothetical protein
VFLHGGFFCLGPLVLLFVSLVMRCGIGEGGVLASFDGGGGGCEIYLFREGDLFFFLGGFFVF